MSDSDNPIVKFFGAIIGAFALPFTLVFLGIAGGSGSRYGSFGSAIADVFRTIGFLLIAPFVILGFAALWSVDHFLRG